MSENRLKLDFTLETNIERTKFLEQYLAQETFLKRPLTEKESETCANYILWGKDPQTGLNSKQSKEIQLESRNKTWDTHQDESLEALFESPAFSENSIRPLNSPRTKITRTPFSREEAKLLASPEVLEQLTRLWRQIDETDLILNFYDLAHNKRKTSPRPELLNSFSEAEQFQLQQKADSLNQFKYLKLRHLLVELRKEQFTYRDFYTNLILPDSPPPPQEPSSIIFEEDIQIFPLGLFHNTPIYNKIFSQNISPFEFSELELKEVSNLFWEQKKIFNSSPKFYFDFRELEHIYNLFLIIDKFEDQLYDKNNLNTLNLFINTLKFYVTRADLTDSQLDILHLKLNKIKNQEIADFINNKYNKTYGANYISTIFRQKIIPLINEAAREHENFIANIFFPENFKKCKHCGKFLLVNSYYFTRKARSIDGFSHQCKKCDKEIRESKKGGK